jgi:hypothetical protein
MKEILLITAILNLSSGMLYAGILVDPNAPSLTLTQKQALEKNKITQAMNAHFKLSISTATNMFNELWNNPQGLTPQQVLDSLSTNAASFVQGLGALITTINTLYPGAVSLTPPHSITINSDHTATVGS